MIFRVKLMIEKFSCLVPSSDGEAINPEINVWLVNTGWTGGGFGNGKRISLQYTRAMIRAALNGDLANVNYDTDEHFNFRIPQAVPGVPLSMLNPRLSWQSENHYDEAANHLAELFIRNFGKYEDKAGAETKAAMPRMLT